MSFVAAEGQSPRPDSGFTALSAAARSAWGKSDRDQGSWLPLWQHMADSGAVAGRLWDAWVPDQVRRLIAEALPGGEVDARRLVVWLATVHDIGKATPAFAHQYEPLAGRMRKAGLDMPYEQALRDDRRLAPHGLAGHILLQEWLEQRHGWTGRSSGQFAVVIGGHHGVPPGHHALHHLQLRPDLLRTPGPSEGLWKDVQYELLTACAEEAGVEERLRAWTTVRLSQPVQVMLSALVILADWIASSVELFPYGRPAADRLERAWRGLDLPGPWCPDEPVGSASESFASRFDLPAGSTVRPVQEEAVRVARSMPGSGLLIIEAPMGEGKTEAALMAGEILAARAGAGGVFVALPTRATGDAMFERLLNWLDRLPGDTAPGRPGALNDRRSVFLAHAKSALNDQWAGLVRAGYRDIAAVELDGSEEISRPGAADRSHPAELEAHQWLRGRKKGMLASFAVGTIDQVLFAGLKSRHLALRHLALVGKVVIIDEVHAYDAYMSTYLERVLQWLGAYRVPVVLLSATLPAARRRALAAAYAGGPVEIDAPADAYPILTAVVPGEAPRVTRPAASGRRSEIRLEPLDDDLDVLVRRLEAELGDGGCALVVRNTVDRVQEAAERLRERFGERNVTVAHSRFLAADRAHKDTWLRETFGPDGERPPGPHVVVASQVIEQSLDVDFDLLVTDLAPTDLMLQRMGRLHRHARRRPARLRAPLCLVTGVEWGQTPPEPVRGSRGVYQGTHTLVRALAVLRPHLDGRSLRLPEDISPLVQAAYGDEPVGPESWRSAMDEARTAHRKQLADKRERAEVFRLGPVRRPGRPIVGWLEAGVGEADETRAGRAQVRDGEESLEVLVVQRRHNGSLATVPWLGRGRGGLELPEHCPPPSRAAGAVAASALTLPWHFSKPWVIDRTIAELERFHVEAWQRKDCFWLAGELILVLDANCQTRLAGYDLKYSQADGLLIRPADARDARVVDLVPAFDLVSRPWIPVQFHDGATGELSLRDVFARAEDVRRLVGDVPTQEFALMRLLLAIAHDALDGPEDLDAWEDLWRSAEPFAGVAAYLDRHRERFDLLHPERPFFQVAGLHTEKNEVAPLNRVVADVPNGEPFFSMRRPGVSGLSFAEGARWLVHAHAFDPSGIKSGAVGDHRVKGGKGYPLGVAWPGNLGGVMAEGDNLRETLLLNLIARDSNGILRDREPGEQDDLPAWRREAPGPGPSADLDEPDARRPSGVCDLYTWQSRRLLLHHHEGMVTGVVLGYGDPLSPYNRLNDEPMTAWRRSLAQEKKQRKSPIYLPRQHDPSRAAWRGLESLLPATFQAQESMSSGAEPARVIPSGIVRWLHLLAAEKVLPTERLIRTRTIGAIYGTQQSVIDEIVDDHVTLPVILLDKTLPEYAETARRAVSEAENAVTALGHLAGNLARAAGCDPTAPTATARDQGFGELDGPYRRWLADLGNTASPQAAHTEWRRTARRIVSDLGDKLLDSAGPASWEGRRMATAEGDDRLIDLPQAEQWFRSRLNKIFPPPYQPPSSSDTATDAPHSPDDSPEPTA
ncbi:type I-E CRISPR-associated protein Cse1/CasA [Streptomyces marincola]|uniref:type I-E CRISPR-associated protein Cse1/CasA n=1 Tax=Streptomyces marincola TaxID=2878388 RepID=UPI001CF18B1F|nr:type I-E CRISPR-associated protein Cse1/CasA [Streptomyces marincola]UCM89732.1 type I-E CRISPR-associated protein Cse1/CasA [Streptomyces marincola]